MEKVNLFRSSCAVTALGRLKLRYKNHYQQRSHWENNYAASGYFLRK